MGWVLNKTIPIEFKNHIYNNKENFYFYPWAMPTQTGYGLLTEVQNIHLWLTYLLLKTDLYTSENVTMSPIMCTTYRNAIAHCFEHIKFVFI